MFTIRLFHIFSSRYLIPHRILEVCFQVVVIVDAPRVDVQASVFAGKPHVGLSKPNVVSDHIEKILMNTVSGNTRRQRG